MKQLLEKHFGKAWLAAVYLFLYIPLFFMIVFSFNSTRQDANFTGFSLRWYEALTRDTKIVEGFWLSVKVAAVTGVLSAYSSSSGVIMPAFLPLLYTLAMYALIRRGWSPLRLIVITVVLGIVGKFAGFL